jgi:sulfoxide reductase heme-binding subunit YedZ
MNDVANHVWWLASRASGVVALLLVTVSVGLGLTMSAKLMRRRGLGPKLLAIHEQTALAGLIALVIHGVTLLGDPWLHPSIAGISVPFTMSYRSFYTGLGIIGGWLAAVLGLTYYVRRRIGAALWRKAHRATVVVYLLGVIHTLGAGTDAGTSWLRWFMVVTGVPIVVLFLRRLLGGRSAAPQARSRVAARPPMAVWEESA